MPRQVAKPLESNIIFRASFIFGIFPFRNIDNVLKMDRVMLLYSVVVVSSLTIFSIWFFYFHEPLYGFSPSIDSVFLVLMSSHQFLPPLLLTFIYFNQIHVEETFKALKCLKQFYDDLETNDWNKSTQRNSSFYIFLLFLNVLIIFLFRSLYYYNYIRPYLITLFILVNFLGCAQFIVIVDTVNDMFDSSIKILNRLKRPAALKRLETIEKVTVTINRLITTSDKIEAIYTHQMLFNIFEGFLSIIVNLYSFFWTVSSTKRYEFRLLINFSAAIWMRFYAIWKVTHASYLASSKCKEFNSLLNQLMIEDSTNEMLRSAKLKLHIAMKREVVFTACGFFNLDYTLLHSIIASATTYLVILIQFGDSRSRETIAISNLTATTHPMSTTT